MTHAAPIAQHAPTGEVQNARAWFGQARARGLASTGMLVVVSVADQRLALVSSEGWCKRYVVSTSAWGVGNAQDSNQTPLGWHEVAAWIGGRAVPGQVFVSRQPVARVLPAADWQASRTEDLVLTRILHLRGLEPDVNAGGRVDSFARCIYLHGTNQEQLLGRPASHGCIRLSNRDVMEIYDLTEGRSTFCWIVRQPLAELR